MSDRPTWAKDWKWWCEACGTLSNDGECDCTKFEETICCQKLRRVAGLNWDETDITSSAADGESVTEGK